MGEEKCLDFVEEKNEVVEKVINMYGADGNHYPESVK